MTNAKQLYTLITEYRGGTYISQARGSAPGEAFSKWLNEAVPTIPSAAITQFKDQVQRGDKPVGIQGLSNAWCISAEYAGQLILVHIVATV